VDLPNELREAGARRRFPPGATLFLEGDHAHEVLLLLEGAVKVTVASSEGREIVLDVFEPGALIGELSVVDHGPRTATVTALSPVEVLTVPAGVFNDYLDRHPQLLRGLLVEVVGRLRTRVRHQLEFGAGDALGRVCARLAELADRAGAGTDGAVVVHLPVSQSDLAAWTGLSREAVVKTLRGLRRLGWVETSGRAVTIRELAKIKARATG
jgi:CRP-like cAMP-binding protein